MGTAMAAALAAAGGAGPAVLQVAGLYRGLCAVRSRALGRRAHCQPRSCACSRCAAARAGPSRGRPTATGSRDELEANPFYDRYRDKIQQLRRCGPRRRRGGEVGRRAARSSGVSVSDALSPSSSPARDLCFCPHSKITQLV